MMTYDEYIRWWQAVTDDNGDPKADLGEPVHTLAAHVLALQNRVDRLMDPDEHNTQHKAPGKCFGCPCYLTQCACAYDHPEAVCLVHHHSSEQ